MLLTLFSLAPLLPFVACAPPVLKSTSFSSLPTKLLYFPDSPSVLWHDFSSSTVYHSSDEGASWSAVTSSKGEAVDVILSVSSDSTAYILTDGKTQWRSLNRGETWQSFDTPLPPSKMQAPLGFHAFQKDWVLWTGMKCMEGGWTGKACYDETYYTTDNFATPPKKLLDHTSRCMWAHSTKEYERSSTTPESLVYCIAWEATNEDGKSSGMLGEIVDAIMGGGRAQGESRLYSSSDFFQKDIKFVDLGIGKNAKGLAGIGGVMGYIVTALKPGAADIEEMVLFVTRDSKTWTKAKFPHGHGLKENAYTIVESSPHSIMVDVLANVNANFGILFRSDSSGTQFVRSLEHTNRNDRGLVDYEKIVGIDGVAITNVVHNWEMVDAGREGKRLSSRITFDDGGSWKYIKPPLVQSDGKKVPCDTSDLQVCSLHLHSVTQPHNYGRVFSSTAPGLIMGIGSIGPYLAEYEDCDTFLSTDAGETWTMVKQGAHKYEFGDQGAILVLVDDEESTNLIEYSLDFGKSWQKQMLDAAIRARLLTTIPDSTSKKFLLLGTLSKKDQDVNGKHVAVYIDFASLAKRKCTANDFEKWYARIDSSGNPACLMGHKQYYMRRKPTADCFVDDKYHDPKEHDEICPCTDLDYECDFNFVRGDDGECIPSGPEAIPPGQCLNEGDVFTGSSGYRKIPGNSCDDSRGIKKDLPKKKPCRAGQAAPGLIVHQSFTFPGSVLEQVYFDESSTLLVYTSEQDVWQSNNHGLSWRKINNEGEKILSVLMHQYSKDQAYLIAGGRKVYFTTNKGQRWSYFQAPLDANVLRIPVLDFHPTRPEWLIWTGSKDCGGPLSSNCHVEAFYSRDNGNSWNKIDSYVRICSWGRDKKLRVDEKTIFCESYKTKTGSQHSDGLLQFVEGKNFYSKKTVLFENIVGYATFEEYMVVAEITGTGGSLTLQVSLNGERYASALFPPNMKIMPSAFTVLESTTNSIFLHVTTSGVPGAEWGSLFKSNSNGTYFTMSLDHVNRNENGYVDFEKMIGLDGIALINIVSNPEEATLTGKKVLQTKITHNDGGRWKPLIPPSKDSLGRDYDCMSTSCALHIHGYTERRDSRTTYSSPTAVGLMIGVGNVGEELAPYVDSDTFLTRDGGFTWHEIHKDAHLWEYGDQGSILVLVNDERPTDYVTYSVNEGLTWQDYTFGQKLRINTIITVPQDTSRKFILFGNEPGQLSETVAIHLDFSQITNKKCNLDLADPNNDDFELWSPSERREEKCLFGRQVMYHRRIRDRNCYVGEIIPQPFKKERDCLCTEEDFECEFNYRRDPYSHKCVIVDGANPLPHNDTCTWGQDYWYERTAYRKVPHSSCVGDAMEGVRLDLGTKHTCPAHLATEHGFIYWAFIIFIPILLGSFLLLWWARRRGGRIYLGEPSGYTSNGKGGGPMDVVASVPYFLLGIIAVTASWLSELRYRLPWNRSRAIPYRQIPIDDDAEVLGDYLEDD